jgi:hypothetical protein
MKAAIKFLLIVSVVGTALCANAQGTAFTYQGRLNDNGLPANGSYDLLFTVYDALTAGSAIGGPLAVAPVAANNGLFTVALDFGEGVFTGPARWLQIGVRTNGSLAAYSVLAPRQPLTAAPYAITAGNVSGPIDGAAILNGTITGAQLASGAAVANLAASGQSGVASGGVILSSNANATDLINAGYVKIGQAELGDFWKAGGLANAPASRANHTAVWTGTEMIVWGGFAGTYLNTGGRYNRRLTRGQQPVRFPPPRHARCIVRCGPAPK